MKSLFDRYEDEAKEERCGLILVQGIVIECKNIHPEPEKGFEIDPEVVLKHLDELSGTWHTHPQQSSTLSGEDHTCFTQWPDLDHYIIGEDGVRIYQIMEGAVIDVNYIPRPTG